MNSIHERIAIDAGRRADAPARLARVLRDRGQDGEAVALCEEASLLEAAQGDRLPARGLLDAVRALHQRAGIDAGVEECSRRIAQLA
jgi:hypothetical protein